ncbi:hypothetical protein AB685_17020 [Bacillus sp. LL01]|uniref:P-loop NTPase fold protein n=1 Tax=Bacillus sp. LL01 TaxID=1665556 RepID=UPI00064D3D28|nr:P-loop NTPase fold protein [Bacillus sp. LL01]KMJ57120.1 hypothetical protein AB685_17020 [Bacillus sp. LL01]
MVKNYKKVSSLLKKSFVFVFAFVLLFEIVPFRSIIIGLLMFAEENNILLGIKIAHISEMYVLFKKIALIYLLLCIISFFIISFYLKVRNYHNNPKHYILNTFEESLTKYIRDKPNGKGYLVTGEWGSGKTYIVTEYFNKFYSFSKKPIYRISCFGLDSRELILNEIKNQIEINDESFLNWIQYIPAIGKPLYGILKDSYSLNSIPKGSILIFDDFERITSLGISNNRKDAMYEKDRSILRNRGYSRTTQIKEFEDINDEFIKIEKAFKRYSKENEITSIMHNLQKYNIATGLINELIENYSLKVIILCNVDILGYDYVDKVFRGKLDCITYNKSIDVSSIESIFNSSFKNLIFKNKEIENFVLLVNNKIINDFNELWILSGRSNLRQAKSIVQAYLDTVNIISAKISLTENYLISLFYSIYTVKVLRDENNLKHLEHFLVGGNLSFFLELYEKKDLYELLISSKHIDSLKWTGISIAGFWILNTKKPDNIDNLIQYYKNYEYYDLELALLQRNYNLVSEKLLIEHVLHAMYVESEESRKRPEKRNIQLDEFIRKARINIRSFLENSHDDEVLMEEKVRNLLCKVHKTASRFDELWYKAIYEYSKVESVIEENGFYILEDYNRFVQNIKNTEEQSKITN